MTPPSGKKKKKAIRKRLSMGDCPRGDSTHRNGREDRKKAESIIQGKENGGERKKGKVLDGTDAPDERKALRFLKRERPLMEVQEVKLSGEE